MQKERILIKISPVGCTVTSVVKMLKAIAKDFPKAKVRQEKDLWIVFEGGKHE